MCLVFHILLFLILYCTGETETILVNTNVWLKKMSKCGFGCMINIICNLFRQNYF